MNTCYKIILKDDARRISMSATNDCVLEYFEDKFTLPVIEESPIFVFPEFCYARDYFIGDLARDTNNYELWEAETTGDFELIKNRLGMTYSKTAVLDFWFDMAAGKMYNYDMRLVPYGTRGVKDLRLVKQISMVKP